MSEDYVLVRDPLKEADNIEKHGVDFGEAFSIFYDSNAKTRYDVDHSTEGDERWNKVGKSDKNRLLFLVYGEDEPQDGMIPIRIISARRELSKKEKDFYTTGTW